MSALTIRNGTPPSSIASSTNSPTLSNKSPYPATETTHKFTLEFLLAQKNICVALLKSTQSIQFNPKTIEALSCATIYHLSQSDIPLFIQSIAVRSAQTIHVTFSDDYDIKDCLLVSCDAKGGCAFKDPNRPSLADAF